MRLSLQLPGDSSILACQQFHTTEMMVMPMMMAAPMQTSTLIDPIRVYDSAVVRQGSLAALADSPFSVLFPSAFALAILALFTSTSFCVTR
jgi:hypothetical protein